MTGPGAPHPAWCTTAHGATLHPDDEHHRSEGVALQLVTRSHGGSRGGSGDDDRSRGGSGGDDEVDAEIGLVRDDAEGRTWVVIEGTDGFRVEVTLGSARRLVDAILSDPALADALLYEAL